eukprot:scaffold152042_cov14-Tisochrysis_lutea.AAC.1
MSLTRELLVLVELRPTWPYIWNMAPICVYPTGVCIPTMNGIHCWVRAWDSWIIPEEVADLLVGKLRGWVASFCISIGGRGSGLYGIV